MTTMAAAASSAPPSHQVTAHGVAAHRPAEAGRTFSRHLSHATRVPTIGAAEGIDRADRVHTGGIVAIDAAARNAAVAPAVGAAVAAVVHARSAWFGLGHGVGRGASIADGIIVARMGMCCAHERGGQRVVDWLSGEPLPRIC